jgi:hypothetical protein
VPEVSAFLGVKSNAEIDAEQAEANAKETPYEQPPPLDDLVGYVLRMFDDSKTHLRTTGITQRLLDARRQVAGEYDDETKEDIEKQGGSDLFFNITATKTDSAEAWIQDVLAPADDKPWQLKPTPIPTLPEDALKEIETQVTDMFAGQQPTLQEVRDVTMDVYDIVLYKHRAEAKTRARRMERVIEDQATEGKFIHSLHEFINQLVTYPNGFLKGPVIRMKSRLTWGKDYAPTVEEQPVHTWTAPSPLDIFPAPNARTPQEGYLIERVRFDVRDLQNMRNESGWISESIDALLNELPWHNLSKSVDTSDEKEDDTDRADLENRDLGILDGQTIGTLTALEYWGMAQGKLLEKYNLEGLDLGTDEARNRWYNVTVIVIGRYVVRAVLNPHPLGLRPYYMSSFKRIPGSFWGKAIPEAMRDCQKATNASLRNLINNLALASGPQYSVDLDAVEGGEEPIVVVPWKCWQYRSSQSRVQEPVKFFQPKSNAAELTDVGDYFARQADDRILIPRYAHGNEEVGGAGQTASGLSMLMGAAAKGIKRLLLDADENVISEAIRAMYIWNMLYNQDISIKGDVQVVARGAMALLRREQTQQKRLEFLQLVNNPVDNMIVAPQQRANLLREIARDLDMPVDDIVPPKEELDQRIAQIEQAAAQEEEMERAAAEPRRPLPTRRAA